MKKIEVISALFFFSVLMCNGQWTYDNLSEPKTHMGVAVLGSKAYLAGGMSGNNQLSTVEIYDAETGEWNTDYNLSQARMLPAGVACGSKVLFAGGIDLTGPPYSAYAEVDIFDTLNQEWTVEYLSVARLVSAVSFGNTVLFAGGGTIVPWAAYNIVDIYNIETGDWDTAYLSEARDVRSAAVVDDLALFAGGNNNGLVSNTVDIYNFTTGIWSVDTLSVPRDRIQAVTIDNKVLFAGGMTADNQRSDVVDIYDATTGTWSIDTLSFPRAFSNNTCGAKACDKAFFAGGGNLDLPTLYWNNVYDNIDIYDKVSDTWTQDNLDIARIEHVVAGVGNQLIVAGGYNSSWQQITSVEIFTCPPSSCLPEGITFSSQEEIDNFQINHPYCTEIEGNVEINGDDITNLNGLNGLISLGGFLTIHGNDVLTSLSGLNNIVSIEGSLTIGGYYSEINPVLNSLSGLEGLVSIGGSLFILNNNMITNTSGLNNLNSIGEGISIVSNDLLNSIASLNNLTLLPEHLIIMANQSLTSFMGLDNLTSIGGTVELGGNASMNNLSGLENISIIGGDLKIGSVGIGQNLTSLTGLDGLISISGNLNIGYIIGTFPVSNPLLSSLNGLNNLTSVGGGLTIMNNDTLISLAGLDSLSTIGIGITNDGGLFIGNNNSLSNLTELHNLTNIGGNLGIRENNTLVSLLGLENINSGSIIDLSIFDNNSLSNCDAQSICDYLAEPNGTITIDNNATGCNSEQEVQDDCDSITYIEELIIEELFTLSPNPVSGAVHLRFTIPKASGNDFGLTICDLYELSGVKVRQLVSEEKMSGTYELDIDLSDLKPGIYFCILKTPQYTETKKIIKLN